jgi:hypothetical protein
LVLKLFSGLQGSPIDSCLGSVASLYDLWCHAAIIAIVPSVHSQSSLSQGLHKNRYSMSLSSTDDRMDYGFRFGCFVRLHSWILDLRTTKITRLPPRDFDLRKRPIGNSGAFLCYLAFSTIVGSCLNGVSAEPAIAGLEV